MLYGLQMDIVTDHLNKNDKKNGTAAPTNENNTHMFRFGIKHQHSNL